jgi:YqaJ-like viral recombinase domain
MRLLMDAAQVAGDRDTWRKTRLGDAESGPRIGASEIAAVMGLPGARPSAYKLWMIKTGRWPEQDDPTDQMDFGTFCEPFSRRLLARDFTDLHFLDGGLYCHDGRPWQAATFDLLAHPAAGCACLSGLARPRPPSATVQQKNSAYNDWHELGVPYPYRAQALWEADIAGVPMAYLAPFDRVAVTTELYEIPVDDQARRDLDLMYEAAEAFRDLVARDVPPPVDGHPDTGLALRRRWSAVDPAKTAVVPWRAAVRWRRAGQAETAAAKRKARYANLMLARAEDAGQMAARDPDTGQLVTVATRRIGTRRGYTVPPNPRVDTLAPDQKWKP